MHENNDNSAAVAYEFPPTASSASQTDAVITPRTEATVARGHRRAEGRRAVCSTEFLQEEQNLTKKRSAKSILI